MLKEIPKSDVIVRPLKVYKEWPLDENSISPIFGENADGTLIDLDTDNVTVNGLNKKVVYASIKSQFYTNSATASLLTEVGRRKSYASNYERVLENEIAVFSIPQVIYGEGIKPGTVVFTNDVTSKTFTDDSYSNLIDSGSNVAGNIFYDRGLVVLTRGITSGSGVGNLTNFTLNFRSTKTIYENEIFISVLENEFNFSQNPSAVNETDGVVNTYIVQRPGSIRPDDLVNKSFYNAGTKIINDEFNYYEDYVSLDPTGSFLAPYITTIGLYDNELNMVAVAKLPQPIKSTPDYPINFIIRFDS
jgi:hypothetical protein